MKLRKRQPLRTGRQQFGRQGHLPSMLSGVHATSQGGILNRACAQGGSYTCSKVFKTNPRGHVDHALQLLLPDWLH